MKLFADRIRFKQFGRVGRIKVRVVGCEAKAEDKGGGQSC